MISTHLREQAFRFVRLLAFALVTQVVALQGTHPTRTVAISAAFAALETVFRQLWPAVSVKTNTAADQQSVVE